ncbi:integral membrane protein TerC [Gracilibacillus halophilus YIM-C55.5]|uniref:Integral membrane protein TerC n=1 Tax=Gracilibacillus halophilus YIM-C55.5 TaxID=1308866 RepID=N4WDT0_9BACI|nr:integral membrane protein TerC [Gracilibacillus halophilus YIM-C55.5]
MNIDILSQFIGQVEWMMLLQLIAIDIVLSGDNALIIAMATKNLDKQYQNRAILFGVAGAIVLRIVFASGIVFLLKIPLIYLVGGMLLIWIGYKITVKKEETHHVSSHSSLYRAIWTIIAADAIMSLDNVVAIAGAARGNIPLLAIGVLISIPIMIYGAKFIVVLFERYPMLIYVGSAILVYTGADMIIHDSVMFHLLQLREGIIPILLSCIVTIGVLLSSYVTNQRLNQKTSSAS